MDMLLRRCARDPDLIRRPVQAPFHARRHSEIERRADRRKTAGFVEAPAIHKSMRGIEIEDEPRTEPMRYLQEWTGERLRQHHDLGPDPLEIREQDLRSPMSNEVFKKRVPTGDQPSSP
jgi:hypothetical protein